MKGKPRGYAFVQYASAEVSKLKLNVFFISKLVLFYIQSAAKALQACDQKLVRGRKISVTYANQVCYNNFILVMN